MDKSDNYYMQQAIQLAMKGYGNTSPNPMVGAIIVKNRGILGRGYHKYASGDHAEIMAIKNSKGNIKGARLYVTLEPCAHYGRTPPCVDAIIQAGFKEVIIGCKDPNPQVNGKGIKKLKSAGIKVITGILEEKAEKLNEGYIYFKKTGKPFVILKIAESLDGKIATSTGESKWITGKESRNYVQKLRIGVDAILVGSGTVLKDNPELIVHSAKKYRKYPARIVLDSRGIIPENSNIFKPGENVPITYWITGTNISKKKIQRLKKFKHIENIQIPLKNNHIPISRLLSIMAKRGVQSILVEGGAKISGSFIDDGKVNKIICFIAPKIIGGEGSITAIKGKGITRLEEVYRLKKTSIHKSGDDFVIEGYF